MRPLLLALCLVLAAPAAALAREPIISYVDENGVFRLYDEEIEAEIEPPLPVPANFPEFRYGMSLDGRYVVFNDTDEKLHLLDRATNTEIPLPGIDVHDTPRDLTVSNTGLIGFDDGGQNHAVLYDSVTKTFVDSGLGADNGHRQTRLSGDGRFLATTCLSDCVVDFAGDGGARPYVQDLLSKTDTGFPNNDDLDEEHPCVDGDGSLVGIDRSRSAAVQKKDIFLFDTSVEPPAPVDLSGIIDEAEEEIFCVLDAGGEYLGFFNNDTAKFEVVHLATGTPLILPDGKEFDITSLFSAPYTPPPPPDDGGPNGGPGPDVTSPVASRFRMTNRRFRPRRRATVFRFLLSEPGDARIVIRRRGGRRVGALRRPDRPAGLNRIPWNGRVRGRALKPGRYVAILFVTDEAGNVSEARRFRFRVLPRRARR